MVYYKFKYLFFLDRLKMKWFVQMIKLSQVMNVVDREVMGKYRDVVMKDVKRILIFNKGVKNQDVVKVVYSKLSIKFYWRNWFVVVYNVIGGYNNYQVWVCNGGIFF